MDSSLVCPQCEFSNRTGSKFCGHCGAPLVNHLPTPDATIAVSAPLRERAPVSRGDCQHCGSANDEDAQLCKRCGARLLVECPQCGAVNRATLNLCAHCGFDYSRFVAQSVIEKLDRKEAEEKESTKALGFSSGIMIALVIFSILIAIYILRQI